MFELNDCRRKVRELRAKRLVGFLLYMLTQHVKKRCSGRILAASKVVRERPRCGEGERVCGLSENSSQRLIERMLCFN